MKIGIITATKEEITAIKAYIVNSRVDKIFNLYFINGMIGKNEVIVCESGVGKVNASRTTQLLIDNYDVDYVINIGVAGALTKKLNIGDIVIGKYLVQHDFDITKFNHEKGYIPGLGIKIESDKNLLNMFVNNIDSNVTIGTIATGDIFCTDINMSLKIHDKFNADCVEMEGAAIAQVCYLCTIPFIIIRSISDVVNGANTVDYDKFVVESANKVAKLLNNIILKLNN